jgi:hypothetical protein
MPPQRWVDQMRLELVSRIFELISARTQDIPAEKDFLGSRLAAPFPRHISVSGRPNTTPSRVTSGQVTQNFGIKKTVQNQLFIWLLVATRTSAGVLMVHQRLPKYPMLSATLARPSETRTSLAKLSNRSPTGPKKFESEKLSSLQRLDAYSGLSRAVFRSLDAQRLHRRP